MGCEILYRDGRLLFSPTDRSRSCVIKGDPAQEINLQKARVFRRIAAWEKFRNRLLENGGFYTLTAPKVHTLFFTVDSAGEPWFFDEMAGMLRGMDTVYQEGRQNLSLLGCTHFLSYTRIWESPKYDRGPIRSRLARINDDEDDLVSIPKRKAAPKPEQTETIPPTMGIDVDALLREIT
jgi:hypothetical protein